MGSRPPVKMALRGELRVVAEALVAPWPVSRSRGAKAAGRAYERNVAHALRQELGPPVRHGLWLEYEDDDGVRYAQPDILIVEPKLVLVLESKRTSKEEAFFKLKHLYVPLASKFFQRPAYGIQVCQNLVGKQYRDTDWHVFGALEEAKRAALFGIQSIIWHFPNPLAIRTALRAACVLLCLATPAAAHDWIPDGLKWCCDDKDCLPFPRSAVKRTAEGYVLQSTNQLFRYGDRGLRFDVPFPYDGVVICRPAISPEAKCLFLHPEGT